MTAGFIPSFLRLNQGFAVARFRGLSDFHLGILQTQLAVFDRLVQTSGVSASGTAFEFSNTLSHLLILTFEHIDQVVGLASLLFVDLFLELTLFTTGLTDGFALRVITARTAVVIVVIIVAYATC